VLSLFLKSDSRKEVNVKKNLTSSVIVILLLTLPLLSFAKTAISDQELGLLSAEAGVTLDFTAPTYTAGAVSGSVMVTNWAPSMFAWGDEDGFGSTFTGLGWLGATNISMGAASNIIMYNRMTLDVGSSGTVTRLNIGLPSVLIHPVETNVIMRVGQDTVNDLNILGTFYNDKFALIVNPFGNASITISNHADNTQGLEMALNNFYLAIPSEEIDISWGDANDGFTCDTEFRSATSLGAIATNVTLAYDSAGYVGLRNYSHGGYGTSNTPMLISMSGTTSIDVGTSGTQTSINLVLPTTVVNAGLANITAPLVVSTAKELPGSQIVGILDVRGFSTTMSGSMQIYAH